MYYNFSHGQIKTKDCSAYLATPFLRYAIYLLAGECSYWVEATENADGTWIDFNGNPISSTPGTFFTNATNGINSECGLMSNANSFFLIGATCSDMHCYICQKNI